MEKEEENKFIWKMERKPIIRKGPQKGTDHRKKLRTELRIRSKIKDRTR